MARGSAIWYFGASIVIPILVYWILTATGWDAVLGVGLAVLVFVLTFPIAIALWVYQDARERGWSGLFWAIISIIIPFGFVFYLFARREVGRATKAFTAFVLYGIAYPLGIIAVVLITTWGGILIVMAALVWMGFSFAMLNPTTA